MQVVFSIIGAVIGLGLAGGPHELFGLLLGAVAGFALADVAKTRSRLTELEKELGDLRKLVALRSRQDTGGQHPADQTTGWSRAADASRPVGQAASADLSPAATRMGQATAASPPSSTATSAPPAAGTAVDMHPAAPVRPVTTPPPREWEPYAAASKGAPLPGAVHVSRASPDNSGRRHGSGDDGIETVLRVVREYFTGGNTLVRVGIIILFFGIAFLLRYAAEHSHVPIELRLSGVAAGGVVLLLLGWKLRARRPGYALALQGGAVGILYLTVFAGLRIYSVLPAGAAFALLAVVAAFSAALAILQNSQSFALLALTGGFLAPVLAATGQGNHIVLFSYYAVLNGVILAIAWFKAWRPLNVAGFLFTFVIGTAWGVLSYQPALFESTEPFLVLFFLFYVVIAILFASRQPPQLRGYIDGTLVFGTPIVAFGLQSGMLHERPFALAYSALAVSALYLVLATLIHRRRQVSQRLLVEAFMALGVLFLTLAVPLALSGRWSAATWALEGTALVWIGCRQERRLARAFGALLQVAGGIIFFFDVDAPRGYLAILNSAFLGGAMVSAASVFSAGVLQRYRDRLDHSEIPMAPVLFFWGLFWWLFSGLTEIQRSVPDRYEFAAGLLFMAVTALMSSELQRRARLSFARLPAIWLLPAMLIYAGIAVLEVHHPGADGGWFAWPLTFGAFYFVCKRHEGEPGGSLAALLHAGSAWLLTALLSWEAAWEINKGVAGAGSWPVIAWALVPAIALFTLPRLIQRIEWPFRAHGAAYMDYAGAGVAVYLALWSLYTNVTLAGDPYPLPFLPVLNPLDLGQLFVLLVLLRFCLHASVERLRFAGLAVLTFIWLNAALLRTVHHWAGIPFQLEPLLRSTLVQTSLSIFWTVLALTTMLAATRRGGRTVWLTGAGLLAVVIAKLFLVDLSHIGTVERIISFVGVGLLMLVIGYFSPLPPVAGQKDAPTRASA
jgi:uncharacterized membrane protein